jgi:hypothetical protein
MKSGDAVKTSNYTIEFWWESGGAGFDLRQYGKVGTWISQNGRVLDKKTATEVVKLVREQFPELTDITAKHVQLRWAKV